MNKTKIIRSILGILISTPIWYYLVFKILKSIQATELMWFLYWIYVPVGILVSILLQTSEDKE